MKHTLKCVAAAMTMLTAATAASAQTVTGTAMGCFSATPGGCVATAGASSFGTLTYYSGSFSDVVNSFGVVNFGGNPMTNSANFNNFGSFALGSGPFVFGNPASPSEYFTLALTFTSPQSGSIVFGGSVTGQVLANGGGGVNVNFPINGYLPVSGTSMLARVNDVDINSGQLIAASGAVTATVTPEPASLVLVGTGLLGMLGLARRKKSFEV